MRFDFLNKIKSFLAPLGRFFARAACGVWAFLCRSKRFARFAYVTFPAKRKSAEAFLKKYKYKIIIPAAVCVIAAAVLVALPDNDTGNSDYYSRGDDTADFGMVLQHYSTFDHSEKTHIAVALDWKDGALNLQDGKASSRIKAKVYPVNLENSDIAWSSSDEEIASVDGGGRIEAKAPGRVEITARLKNYDRLAKAKLSIRQPVSGIILSVSTTTIYMGGGAKYLQPRVFPRDATNKNVTWHSKDTKVARVDNNGTVKPVGTGITEITAVTEDGGFEAKCFVTVANPSVEVESISLRNEEDMSLRVGESISAIMTVSPSNARNKTLKWFSDNDAVATVSQTGRIRAVGEGAVYITAESVNGRKQKFLVEVASSDKKDSFILNPEDDENEDDGAVTYTSYDTTFPQAVRIQMAQNPPPKVWTSGGMVSASEAQTAEYMNPNNYYDGAYKYQFLDLSRTNGVSEDALNAYLADKGILRGQGAAFIEAAKEYNISEVYLAAHACLESGNGTSKLSTGVTVNGSTVYNMFGIGAYDSSALISGSQRAYNEGWTSVESAIMGGARWISEHYINSTDTRQNTLYKMLWNPEKPGYHQYATDAGWAVKQALNMDKIFSYAYDTSLSYEVPVYNGMIPPDISAD